MLVIDDSTYHAFPGVTRLDDNSLFAASRQGTDHLAGGDLVKFTANAAGSSWSGPSDLIDTAKDIRDVECATLSDGRVVISYTERTAGLEDFVTKVMFSTDATATSWDSPVTVTNGFTGFSFATAKMVEDENGYLYLPMYGIDAGGVNGTDDYCRVSRSTTPGGSTFAAHSVIVASGTSGRAWNEPNIARLSTPGHYVCSIRADVGAPQTFLAWSTDYMATWSAPALAFNGGGRPSIIETSDGALMVAHRNASGIGEVRWTFDQAVSWASAYTLPGTQPYVYGSWVVLSSGDIGLLWAIEEGSDTDANLSFDVWEHIAA